MEIDMKRLQLSWNDLGKIAQDSDDWKLLVRVLYPTTGQGH